MRKLAEQPPQSDLRSLIKLVAIQLTAGLSTIDAIVLLNRAGLDRGTIAEVCETSTNAVHARLSEAKRKKSRARKTVSRKR